ncbi:hypothetical protein [Leptospira sp. GIMC2001]|uniref:hypothetical protein n=1 Tax=Leptospira sp. GIMC2001 TaxID=1513297 RepID=UPI0023493EB5|nr:hypothetical protein [Leptospira sp. GIMC2001]WCL47681.1 hypothetical protein O4O04_00045 [Leptospira sp. GIMC2001]
MNQKTILYSLITIISLILAYFLFLPSNQKKRNADGSLESAKDVNYSNSREALLSEKKDSSLFDSENGFLDFSSSSTLDTQSSSSNPSNPIAITPEERARRKQLAIDKFQNLAKVFPNNRYIPRKLTPEQEASQKKREAAMNSLYERVLYGDELNPDEKIYFYQNKRLESTEKLELLDYVKTTFEQRNGFSETTKNLLESKKDSIQKRLATYENELNDAVKLGGSEGNYTPPELSEYEN